MQHILRNTGKVFESREFFINPNTPLDARAEANPAASACANVPA